MTALASTEIVRMLIHYHITSNQQRWKAIKIVGDVLFFRENSYAIGLMHNHMMHVMHIDCVRRS